MRKILVLAIAALVAFGCVYEFEPDIRTDDAKGLVVEGDILIGDVSSFTLSSIEPLSGDNVAPVRGWVWIEDDAGGEYYPESSDASDSFSIDMTKASAGRKYRLRIRLATGFFSFASRDAEFSATATALVGWIALVAAATACVVPPSADCWVGALFESPHPQNTVTNEKLAIRASNDIFILLIRGEFFFLTYTRC